MSYGTPPPGDDRPDPTSFSFRSADRSFGLYGWRVRLRTGDPGLRFTRLQVTGRRGFSLRARRTSWPLRSMPGTDRMRRSRGPFATNSD